MSDSLKLSDSTSGLPKIPQVESVLVHYRKMYFHFEKIQFLFQQMNLLNLFPQFYQVSNKKKQMDMVLDIS